MLNPITFITKTPLWVWVVFIYLLFIGVKSLKTHVVPVWKMFVLPLFFMVIKYKVFLSPSVVRHLFFMSIGGLVGFFLTKDLPIKILKAKKSIEIPGNYLTLIFVMSFFFMKYTVEYLQVAHPSFTPYYYPFDSSITGLFSGYFLG